MYLAALSVIQAIILPNPSLHLTPYTVCITDPQGSEWAMRGRGLGGGGHHSRSEAGGSRARV